MTGLAQTVRFFPVQIPLGLAIIILQSTLLAELGRPNLLIVLILHLVRSGHLFSGGLMVFFFGLVQDTLSGAPAGLSSLFYLLIFFLGSLVKTGLSQGRPVLQIGIVAAALVTHTLFLSWLVDSSFPSLVNWISIFFTVLVSPFLFVFFSLTESLYLKISRPRSVE